MKNPQFKFATVRGLGEEFLPRKAHKTDTGYDVFCAIENSITIKPFERKLIPLGIKALIPDGWWLELRPRSSSFYKKNLNALYGVIDEQYENEIMFACQYIPQYENAMYLQIDPGDKIGQLVPVPRYDMDVAHVTEEEFSELSKNRAGTRQTGGFGSTG